LEKKGKVIIPAFSVGRTQQIVYTLHQLTLEGRLPRVPIFVDSPLSVNATEVFRHHPECYDEEARDFWRHNGDVFGKGWITYLTDVEDSKALHERPEPCVIIASSGMCEAGRILHHLKNNVENSRNTVVIVGYMAENTLGRRLVDKVPQIKVFGREYRLNCEIVKLNGFSGHAGADELERIMRPIVPGLKAAFVVHGEGERLTAMEGLLQSWGCPRVVIPAPGDRYKLGKRV
jgi:metallo-beta-lactamase family protein